MRNLKRVLALALALVMVIGMMVMGASAASYTDAADITADYQEAIDVMSGVGMFEGNDKDQLLPTEILTQKEAATLLARLMLGKATADKLIATQQIFSDVAVTDWYAPYVEYCYQAGLIAGNGKGEFNPDAQLTGIAFAKLLLVAAGYDAAAQGYVGANWAANIAVDALNAGLKVEDVVLSAYVTRELAAQMLLQALEMNMVEYNTSYDYATGAHIVTGPFDKEVATNNYWWTTYEKVLFMHEYFPGLVKTEAGNETVWGRPYDYQWTYGTATLYTAWETPVKTYITSVAECQFATDLGIAKTKTYTDLWVNGATTGTYTVNATDIRTLMGGQGRLTEVYKNDIVYIDTYLAQVTGVTVATYDRAGHLYMPATLSLTVYDGTSHTTNVVLTNGATNYTYAVGEMLLVNAHTNTDGTIKVTGTTPEYLVIDGVSTSIVGAQTRIHVNEAKHTISEVTYDDACKYYADTAANTASTKFVWNFDQYGNLIGSFPYETVYSYATIQNIQWVNPLGSKGYALATLLYVDGTAEQKIVSTITSRTGQESNPDALSYSIWTGDYATGGVSANWAYNTAYVGQYLFTVAEKSDGTVGLTELTPIYDAASKNGQTIIAGDDTSGEGGTASYIYVDNATQILVRSTVGSSYTWSAVVGYSNLPTLTDATAFAVYLNDGDSAAEYVYIYGTVPSNAKSSELLVYVDNLSYSYVAGTTDYVTMYGLVVDGVATPVVGTAAWIDGAGNDMKIGRMYILTDNNGDGVYDTGAAGDGWRLAGGTETTLADGKTHTIRLFAGEYTLSSLMDAIEPTGGSTVPYGIVGATVYNYAEHSAVMGDGYTDVVLVYTTDSVTGAKTVSAIYVIDTIV